MAPDSTLDIDVVLRHNVPRILGEIVDGDLIIVDFETGHYYSMNPSGSDVWRSLEHGSSARMIIEKFTAAHPSEAVQSVSDAIQRVLGELRKEDLIVVDSGPAAQLRPPTIQPNGRFVAPELVKYTDMADLLLLDPIHEVDPAGWPHEKNPEP